MKTALICGTSGQDGAYLAAHLLGKGYRIVGTSRDAQISSMANLDRLDIRQRVEVTSMALNDFRSVLQVLARVAPHEVYNLGGQSSVWLSFEQPVETLEGISVGTLNLLEGPRFLGCTARLYNVGSSECFGETGAARASETTPFRPRSPYAVAKACAHNLVCCYREAYRMHACTGILFNHKSPLRMERFVTQKIVRAACRIASGSNEKRRLCNLEIHRDWGWALESVDAMWRMLQAAQPVDLVIATGRSVSLRHFVAKAFDYFGLDWQQHVEHDLTLLRPSDILHGAADATLAHRTLGWAATLDVDAVVAEMCRAAAVQTAGGEVVAR